MCAMEGEFIAVCVDVVELLPLRQSEASRLDCGFACFLVEPQPPTQYRSKSELRNFAGEEQLC